LTKRRNEDQFWIKARKMFRPEEICALNKDFAFQKDLNLLYW
jgi:hypothetical protein